MTHDDLIKLLGQWVRVSNPQAHVTWTGQLVGLADDPSLLLRTGPGQQATLPQSFTVEHLELDPASDVDDEHGKPLHCRDCAQAWLDGKPVADPTHPQDGTRRPQDGPGTASAGAEPPEGLRGAQAGVQRFGDVQGRCPACGGSSLFLGDGGYITCRRLDCPQPDAASQLLERRPTAPGEWLRTGTRDLSIPAHDTGPTIAECRDADRRWPLQRDGE